MDNVVSICVVGLGEVGLPTAEWVHRICSKKRGDLENEGSLSYEIIGFDISEEARKKANLKKIKTVTSMPYADHYIICVNDATPEMSNILSVCRHIWEKNSSSHIYIESTLRLGTSKKIHDKYPSFKIVAYCPHRFFAEEPEEHGVKQKRVLGATTSEGLKIAEEFYRVFLEIPVLAFGLEEVEMCKITENAYRFLLISFAEELAMISDKLDLDFNMLRSAINSKWNIEILEAREGIGGTCLPKDIGFVIDLGIDNGLLHEAIKIDERYKKFVRSRAD